MRNIIFGLLAFFILGACASVQSQKLATEEQKTIVFTEKINLKKDAAFPLVMECLAETFNSAKSVIQYQDKEAGIIVGKAITLLETKNVNVLGWKIVAPLNYTLTIKIQNEGLSFKFVAGQFEDFIYDRIQHWDITESGMEFAKVNFRVLKDTIMKKLNPAYSSEPTGTTHKEGNVTVWTIKDATTK